MQSVNQASKRVHDMIYIETQQGSSQKTNMNLFCHWMKQFWCKEVTHDIDKLQGSPVTLCAVVLRVSEDQF